MRMGPTRREHGNALAGALQADSQSLIEVHTGHLLETQQLTTSDAVNYEEEPSCMDGCYER